MATCVATISNASSSSPANPESASGAGRRPDDRSHSLRASWNERWLSSSSNAPTSAPVPGSVVIDARRADDCIHSRRASWNDRWPSSSSAVPASAVVVAIAGQVADASRLATGAAPGAWIVVSFAPDRPERFGLATVLACCKISAARRRIEVGLEFSQIRPRLRALRASKSTRASSRFVRRNARRCSMSSRSARSCSDGLRTGRPRRRPSIMGSTTDVESGIAPGL